MTKIIMYAVLPAERPYIDHWAQEHQVTVKCVPDRLDAQTVALAKGCDGIDFQQTASLPASVYEQLEAMHFKQLTVRIVGVDMIDFALAKKHHLIVTNVPAYSPRAIAELGLTQTMRLIRKLGYYDQRMANYDFRWSGLESTEIYNLTIGVIGAGHIGGATAQLYQTLGAKVLAVDPFHHADLLPYLTYTDLPTLLAQADVISLHTPLSAETANLVDATFLAKMKSSAYLINMARGGLVDTSALIKALQTNQIAGAALDTLADETQFFERAAQAEEIPDDYLTLKVMPNVLITPHCAFYTRTAMKNTVEMGLDDVLAIIKGQQPRYEVCG
ncbi:MAG: D-2-hydroxyacid dehydrogenase [Lactobacillus sp.]|nr:D-2-hydroxyacid dehydrogenase [Lactobacillus sp.]